MPLGPGWGSQDQGLWWMALGLLLKLCHPPTSQRVTAEAAGAGAREPTLEVSSLPRRGGALHEGGGGVRGLEWAQDLVSFPTSRKSKAGLWRYPETSNLQLLYLPVIPRKGTQGHLEIPGSVSPRSWHISVFTPLTSE